MYILYKYFKNILTRLLLLLLLLILILLLLLLLNDLIKYELNEYTTSII